MYRLELTNVSLYGCKRGLGRPTRGQYGSKDTRQALVSIRSILWKTFLNSHSIFLLFIGMSYPCVTSGFFFCFLSYSNHSLYVLADAPNMLVCFALIHLSGSAMCRCEWLDCSHHLKWSKKTGRKRKMVEVKCPAKRGGQIHQFIYLSTLHNTQVRCSPLG